MAATLPAAMPPPTPIACSVLGEAQGRRMRFAGRLLAQDGAEGRFRLTVDKRGPAGTSTVSQSGSFQAAAGQDATLGTSVLALEPGASYRVSLQVTVGDRTLPCPPLTGTLP